MEHDEICDLPLGRLSALLRTRRLSSREVLEAHLGRIETVNPVLNAVVTLDAERARRDAAAADERAASGAELPLLHGVPMTHKDTHDTAGMRTTLGAPTLAERVPETSTLIIERLNAAGVLTTGKTNVPELAAGSHTFNQIFGTTVNPWDTTRSAGGSSGGVAAVVAAGVQPAGDASDMGGSIRTPASFTNLVGLRPSVGVVPSWPVRDPWAWISRQGPIARCAEDLALMMRVLSPRAAHVPLSRVREPIDFTRALAHDLSGVRIGWTSDLGVGVPVEREVLEVLSRQVAVLESLGAVVEPACPDLRDAPEVFEITRAMDFSVSHAEVYREAPGRFKRSLAENIEKGFALTSDQLRSAVAARGRLHEATTAFFARYDLLAAPAVTVAPFDAALEYPTAVAGQPMADYLGWMQAATLVTATGLPCLSTPAGFTDTGLPVGLQLVAPDGHDLALLDAAHALEQATDWHRRRPPLLTGQQDRARHQVTTSPAAPERSP